jgi:hypothetical protein
MSTERPKYLDLQDQEALLQEKSLKNYLMKLLSDPILTKNNI